VDRVVVPDGMAIVRENLQALLTVHSFERRHLRLVKWNQFFALYNLFVCLTGGATLTSAGRR
jgi:hypothetical protein